MKRVWNRVAAVALVGAMLGLTACPAEGDDCATGETDCFGECVDTMSDPYNCGGCDVMCDLGETCVGGYCTLNCPLGEDVCDGMCVDLMDDPDYCGDCLTMCGVDEICDMGVCVGCALNEDICDGLCVDLQVDPDYCGDCNTSCAMGETCSGGVCGGDCGDMVYSDDAICQGCMETSCCDQMAACAAGTACGDLWDCVDACGADSTCQDGCMTTYSAGLSDAQALVSCADSCSDDCGGGGICDTELSYPSAVMTQCVTDNCCAAFDPCYADADCNACMQNPSGAGCDTNALYDTYASCLDTNCPTDICGSGIGYNSGGDPMFDCNACLGGACCTDMTTCVGDASQAAIDLCIECLTDPNGATCTDATISAAAQSFLTCQTTNCANDC